ncbi:DEAD/DEAH box helicase [Kocuria tytonicola]|uniref:DEAD/DEAH box helicase n=1 Tax=Kocuria tytonicola TaxID=2055946 RepID=A0A3L9L9X1_9MICC|nr:helicase-related protein [Kocuria tytonicola]RLY93897.1 DEAD/DEAH box helicase [Kocuria tytonicola]
MTEHALDIAPGAIVEVRDEQWLVSAVEQTADGELLTVRGVSELVEGTTAQFYRRIDDVRTHDPSQTAVVADTSSHYARSRLWLESTLRKTSLPISDPEPALTSHALADTLAYQRQAVQKALEPERLRTRLLIADAVGLGKTLEIGMILAELIRRGRGRRILVVTPRHVLEQMQHELWTRFAIPFVRLDSEGVQRVKQKLPATRNPFTFFEKVIISIDTLKQDRFIHDLRKHHWDAVVIDESHNVTNQATQNNQLAHILAPNTDALVLASATPHNGRNESFAQLLTLLEPTSVSARGDISPAAVGNLMIRRHRYSDSVKNEVGDRWAERKEPRHIAVTPSPEELAVGEEIVTTWTHPRGTPPVTGKGSRLFPWTLAKAFLSSPVALQHTIDARLRTLEDNAAAGPEHEALLRLRDLNAACLPGDGASPRSGKYRELVSQLRQKNVGPRSPERAVIFAERVPTLEWLREHLMRDLAFKPGQVRVLHGGLTDVEQQELVESFKQASSPIRVLVTGDVASEGVNLHLQCHELIHYDIPWSLIRIEQRNGRIDRYGQVESPQITTLLLDLQGVDGFTGDIRVLTRLVEREREAHEKLGDAASLMGSYSGDAEEKAITEVLRGAKDFEDVVPSPEQAVSQNDDDWLTFLTQAASQDAPAPGDAGRTTERQQAGADRTTGLFGSDVDYLREGLTELYGEPDRKRDDGGVGLEVERNNAGSVQAITFEPSPDLRQRLMALPQSYLEDRGVLDRMRLTPDRATAEARLKAALNDAKGTSWPDTHYLSPLHPVLDWVADRSLAHLGRNEIFAVHGSVEQPTVVLQGIVTNRRGQNIAVVYLPVHFMGDYPLPQPSTGPAQLFQDLGLNPDIVGVPVAEPGQYERLVAPAVQAARDYMERGVAVSARQQAQERADHWVERMDDWERGAEGISAQTQLFRQSRSAVEGERRLAQEMLPDRTYVRPLLVVVPQGGK